jgi:hypothetical protein
MVSQILSLREQHDEDAEIRSYDGMSIAYFYLGDATKANYYLDRY